MLQKDPSHIRNRNIERLSEPPKEYEDQNNTLEFPVQNLGVNGNNSQSVENPSQSIGKPIPHGSTSDTLPETAINSHTMQESIRLNTSFLQELEQLENLVLDSVRVPLTDLVVIDEGLALQQIESIRQQIPQAIEIASAILQRKQEILQEAQKYARESIESANKQAERIIQKSALLRQAELEATQIRVEAQRECQKMRRETQEEIEQWREYAIAEYQEIQHGADEYARNVLGNLEGQLGQMLGIIRNGYQQLESNTVQDKSNHHQQ